MTASSAPRGRGAVPADAARREKRLTTCAGGAAHQYGILSRRRTDPNNSAVLEGGERKPFFLAMTAAGQSALNVRGLDIDHRRRSSSRIDRVATS
jgi:hypothetical protein